MDEFFWMNRLLCAQIVSMKLRKKSIINAFKKYKTVSCQNFSQFYLSDLLFLKIIHKRIFYYKLTHKIFAITRLFAYKILSTVNFEKLF